MCHCVAQFKTVPVITQMTSFCSARFRRYVFEAKDRRLVYGGSCRAALLSRNESLTASGDQLTSRLARDEMSALVAGASEIGSAGGVENGVTPEVWGWRPPGG